MARLLEGLDPVIPPAETMLGALMRYVHETDPKHFQPMNANFGLLPPLAARVKNKRERRRLLGERAVEAMRSLAESTLTVST